MNKDVYSPEGRRIGALQVNKVVYSSEGRRIGALQVNKERLFL
ncbi:uncharacterized protein YrrD [Cytobacillus horneckiae]|nr:hypothetical protein [Cytobacillus horneckiae]